MQLTEFRPVLLIFFDPDRYEDPKLKGEYYAELADYLRFDPGEIGEDDWYAKCVCVSDPEFEKEPETVYILRKSTGEYKCGRPRRLG